MAYNPYLQNPYFQQPGFYGGAMPDALNQMKIPYQPQQMQPQAQLRHHRCRLQQMTLYGFKV